MTPVPVLVNPAARGGRGAVPLDDVLAALDRAGVKGVALDVTDAASATAAAAACVADEAPRLVLVGGDGLVHLAIQSLAGSSTVLGIVPSGTGNDFAGGLGLPSDLDAAVTAALADATPLDLVRIGDTWAASVATAGFSVDVNARANRMRFPRGSARYTAATLLQLPRLAASTYHLDVDGEVYELPAVVVTVANTSDFGGGMRISPRADPTDGVLDLTIVGDVGRVELLRWFRKVFDGSHLDHPDVLTLRGRSVRVLAPRAAVWADGEPVTDAPVTIEAVPGALQVAGVTLPS